MLKTTLFLFVCAGLLFGGLFFVGRYGIFGIGKFGNLTCVDVWLCFSIVTSILLGIYMLSRVFADTANARKRAELIMFATIFLTFNSIGWHLDHPPCGMGSDNRTPIRPPGLGDHIMKIFMPSYEIAPEPVPFEPRYGQTKE